jgi:hypothetical protein
MSFFDFGLGTGTLYDVTIIRGWFIHWFSD